MIASMTFRSVLVLLPLALSGAAVSTAVCAAEMTRAEIGAARARIERTYQDKVRECNQRFVVTGCLEDAREERVRQLRRPGLAHAVEDVLDSAQQRGRSRAGPVTSRDREEVGLHPVDVPGLCA